MKKYRFHNLDFSVNQQAQIVEYYETRKPQLLDILITTTESNLKLSFSWDNFHDIPQMAITPKDDAHPFNGYVVTIRHEDFAALLKVLFWLVAEGFDQIDPPESKKGRYDW